MRLGILIRDREYRDALVERLSSYDNDIFVNIIGEKDGDVTECLILTDIMPAEFENDLLEKLMPRIVFLYSNGCCGKEFHSVFKYSSVNELVSELSVIYNEWHGTGLRKNHSSRIIAVCSESDAYAADKCMSLARQIIYRHGGRVLVIGMGYINDYGFSESARVNRFARLMYSISKGRSSEYESYTCTDSYGVSALMLPPGQNPMAYLSEDELRMLISGLASQFSTLILDIGTCYRKENIMLIRESDSIVSFETGRRIIGLAGIIGREASEKIFSIRISGGTEEAVALDDCIKRIYGIDENESD